jgi:RNA polymerase sigma-70 factor (ECF subfamily)
VPGTERHLPDAVPCSAATPGCDLNEANVDQRGLVERAGKGDHDAFAVLARASVARLDAVARLILRDADLARDAVQEAMVRAWRDLPGLRDPGNFDAWLHRLTVNASIDAIRRRRRRVIEVELTPIHDPAIPDETTRVADRDQVARALERLDPEQRAVIVLHYYLGLPLQDAAAALGIPVGTAKSRLHRALTSLRASLGDEAPDSLPGGQLA